MRSRYRFRCYLSNIQIHPKLKNIKMKLTLKFEDIFIIFYFQ